MKFVCSGVPVVDGHFKAIELLDVVLIGDLHDIAQHILRQVGAGDFYFEARDIEIALQFRFIALSVTTGMRNLLLRRRNRQKSADREAARVFDAVGVGDQAPFAGAAVILRGDARQRIAVLSHVAMRAVRRGQIQMSELLIERLVFAQRHASMSPAAERLPRLKSVNFCLTLSTMHLKPLRR